MLEPAIQATEDERTRLTLSNVYYNLGREIYGKAPDAEQDQRAAIYAATLGMYRAKVDHDSTSYASFLNLGIAGLAANSGEVARDALKQALRLRTEEEKKDPKSILQPLKYLGMAYLILQDNREAVSTFRKVLEINPEDHDVIYRLGIDRAVNKDWGGAIGLLRRAVELKPDSAPYHLLLAQSYYNSQQYGLAIRHYRECLKFDPSNSAAQEQLNNSLTAYEQQSGD